MEKLESVKEIVENIGKSHISLMLGLIFVKVALIHGEQRDLAGKPYMFHIMRVAEQMENDSEIAVALLHDALEDSLISSRTSLLLWIDMTCGRTVAEAVGCLTRFPNEDYMKYIERLSKNPLAVKVKLADLRANTDPDRLSKLSMHTRDRLLKKYLPAQDYLWQYGAKG